VVRAAREADKSFGVFEHVLQADGWFARPPVGRVAGMPVGDREQPAEVLPALAIADEQRQMPNPVQLSGWINRDLCAVDRADWQVVGGHCVLHCAAD
jgi:hypothetical protein